MDGHSIDGAGKRMPLFQRYTHASLRFEHVGTATGGRTPLLAFGPRANCPARCWFPSRNRGTDHVFPGFHVLSASWTLDPGTERDGQPPDRPSRVDRFDNFDLDLLDQLKLD